MQEHGGTICPNRNLEIPPAYIRLVKEKVPLFFIMSIGFAGHGKTTFLSALFYSLYHYLPSIWKQFSFLALNQKSLDKIHREFVQMLEKNLLPPKTPIMFPEPLILRLQGIPMLRKGLFTKGIEPGEAMLIFYDIGGGTFEFSEKLEQNVPLLTRTKTVLFTIYLATMVQKGDFSGADQEWHRLLNVYFNSMREAGAKPTLIIAFSKADLLSGDERFGPLSEWEHDHYRDNLPYPEEVACYLRELGKL